jgi:hypothetical protein
MAATLLLSKYLILLVDKEQELETKVFNQENALLPHKQTFIQISF